MSRGPYEDELFYMKCFAIICGGQSILCCGISLNAVVIVCFISCCLCIICSGRYRIVMYAVVQCATIVLLQLIELPLHFLQFILINQPGRSKIIRLIVERPAKTLASQCIRLVSSEYHLC